MSPGDSCEKVISLGIMKKSVVAALALLCVVSLLVDAAFYDPVVRSVQNLYHGRSVLFFPYFRNSSKKAAPARPMPVAPHHIEDANASGAAMSDGSDDPSFSCLKSPKHPKCDGLYELPKKGGL